MTRWRKGTCDRSTMATPLISPSILSADFARLGQDKPARQAALAQLAKTHALADCPLAAMWQ